MSLPRILLIATGGTIAGVADKAASTTRYQAGALGARALLDAVPEVHQMARIEISQPFNLDSKDLAPKLWLQLAHEVADACRDDSIDAIVITHGTDTLEETAFLLDRLIPPGKPVVMTCAMRPASAHSADGPLNLLHAIELAAGGQTRELGIVAVINEQIHAAARLRKLHTQAVGSFELAASRIGSCSPPSVECRPLGPPRAPQLLERLSDLPRVDVLWVGPATEPDLLSASIAHGSKGLVLQLPGNGSIPCAWESAIGMAMAKGIPVVRSSRTAIGRVARQPDPAGVICAGELSAAQARVALMLALAAGLPADHFIR